jgi:hypothetical protein
LSLLVEARSAFTHVAIKSGSGSIRNQSDGPESGIITSIELSTPRRILLLEKRRFSR